jgi:hypothetical protein
MIRKRDKSAPCRFEVIPAPIVIWKLMTARENNRSHRFAAVRLDLDSASHSADA